LCRGLLNKTVLIMEWSTKALMIVFMLLFPIVVQKQKNLDSAMIRVIVQSIPMKYVKNKMEEMKYKDTKAIVSLTSHYMKITLAPQMEVVVMIALKSLYLTVVLKPKN